MQLNINQMDLNMSEKYIRVETSDNGEIVCIHANKNGIEYLIKSLNSLLDARIKCPDDVVLMTPEWGGDSLSNDTPSDSSILVNTLKIYRWE
jgi:hypothetical protein